VNTLYLPRLPRSLNIFREEQGLPSWSRPPSRVPLRFSIPNILYFPFSHQPAAPFLSPFNHVTVILVLHGEDFRPPSFHPGFLMFYCLQAPYSCRSPSVCFTPPRNCLHPIPSLTMQPLCSSAVPSVEEGVLYPPSARACFVFLLSACISRALPYTLILISYPFGVRSPPTHPTHVSHQRISINPVLARADEQSFILLSVSSSRLPRSLTPLEKLFPPLSLLSGSSLLFGPLI